MSYLYRKLDRLWSPDTEISHWIQVRPEIGVISSVANDLRIRVLGTWGGGHTALRGKSLNSTLILQTKGSKLSAKGQIVTALWAKQQPKKPPYYVGTYTARERENWLPQFLCWQNSKCTNINWIQFFARQVYWQETREAEIWDFI